ncbi:hypothetical protein Ae201684P_002979 [Aphanomyces euteiches]|uniref:Uncharacterized protein n=1 Tax=Aphanomyces euteiches TaxID=100861 RepID=A0A6G0X200_9STRA|nr:hypothetical protein Ae201684_009372 [Aphanomyces euteiches]KAH9070623.1 hypothetical protein Ae201684P_002979 [Aphanomyces euteiches]KAH9156504.1 hypothetical protein AeRB84_001579 [Aphanomyces euteiches]
MPSSYQAIPVSAEAEDSKDTRPVKKPSGPPLSFFLVVGSISIVTIWGYYEFTKTEAFAKTIEWEQKHQLWGGLIYVFVYVVCIMFCCPSTVFDLTAGYLFGFGFGSLVLLLERDALQFVVLVQLASMPIFLKNYGLAILHIPFGLFMWTTIFVGGAKTVLTAYIGHSVTEIAQLFSSKAAATDSKSQLVQEILLIVTVVATLLLAIVGGYKTRKYIDELATKELEKVELLHSLA